LPNGHTVETGFSGYAGSQTGAIYRWGVGPSVDGLFSQSNLGIVTRMTVWLMPAPERFEAFFFRCDDDNALAALVNALRPLRLNGTLRSSIHIGNDYKVLSGLQQYPWDFMNDRTPLLPSDMKHFRKRGNFGAWNGSGGLYGSPGQVKEAKRLVRRALKDKVNRLQFVNEKTIALAERFSRVYSWITGWDLSRALELVKPIIGLMKGVPTRKPLESLYWRNRAPVPSNPDPDHDRCGLIWCAPIVPLDGDHAQKVATLAIDLLLKYEFEPMLSLTLVDDRAISCVVSISYDREKVGEDARARACHGELLDAIVKAGYPPYRLGVQSMNKLAQPEGLRNLLNAVKQSSDPNRILAPGRYDR
jgi:4-cresol dehydrogenase (hydroxylating)